MHAKKSHVNIKTMQKAVNKSISEIGIHVKITRYMLQWCQIENQQSTVYDLLSNEVLYDPVAKGASNI